MRETYIDNGVEYGKCLSCMGCFELSDEFWYRHKTGYKGYSSRCKKCDNEIRNRIGKNPEVSRKADKKYYESHKDKILYNNHKRGKDKGYDKIQKAARRKAKKLGIRPTECPICGVSDVRIVAHHPDYNNRFLVVFCCDSCHRNIHNGNIGCPQPINLSLY